MKGFAKEFREFAMKGNVVDLAVGVIIGTAFGKIVSSIVADIFMPPIGLLIGGVNFTDLKLALRPESTDAAGNVVTAITLNYGSFLQTVFDFIIIAVVVFLVIKGMNSMKKKEPVAEEAPAKTPEDIELLREIRDLLKK